MLQAWWNANIDARRTISLLISVTGLTLVALSVAASSVSLALDGTLLMAVSGPVLGAAVGGYVAHHSSDSRRALLWSFAYGISTGALIVGMFATAALLRPTAQAIPGLGDAWAGLFVGGCLLGFVGALLWERDPRRRRVSAWLLLALWLIVGGAVVSLNRDPWTGLGALVCLVGFGVLLHALANSASLHHGAAAPALWPSGPVPTDPTRRRTS